VNKYLLSTNFKATLIITGMEGYEGNGSITFILVGLDIPEGIELVITDNPYNFN